ncbi:MAG: TlpA family protein disulfide reductase [Muribaculaceae bacterium]|nr:TlpA family protein disulfide reductase [Muribaculaceae bacterium]
MANRIFTIIAYFMLIASVPCTAKGANSSAETSMQDSITVSAHFRNIAEGMPRTATIIECDPSDKNAREICELDSNDSFCRKIPLSYPHTFTVNYNRRNFINAFAAPGDSIYMDIDASASPLSVSFSGDHAEINQQYDAAFQYMITLMNAAHLPADTVAFEEYMHVFKEYVRQGRDSIDIYARKHNLSDEVISMLYADNIYALANSALDYSGRNIEEKRAFFLDPIFDIFNDENTKVMIFPFHLAAIMNHFPDVRDKAPKGTVRDIMYACDEAAPVPDRSVFFNKKYYDRLYGHAQPVKNISIDGIKHGDIIVYADGEMKELIDENPLKWLINEYAGHPVYLDISATWCGACRAGLKGSESLREHFKDSDIRFAVMWLNSSKDNWIKLVPTISNAIHIFIDMDDVEMTDHILGHLNVQSYPTHIMIDKNGNVIKDGVPRYLSPELPDFLNRHK